MGAEKELYSKKEVSAVKSGSICISFYKSKCHCIVNKCSFAIEYTLNSDQIMM